MSRYYASCESPAALAAGAKFASLQAGASAGLKLRRVILGVRAGTGAPTSQQITVALQRVTVRGVGAASTVVGAAMQATAAPTSQITGLDVGPFGTSDPTLAAGLIEVTFNSTEGGEEFFEWPDDFGVLAGAANGIGFTNLANALPASHLLTLTAIWDE